MKIVMSSSSGLPVARLLLSQGADTSLRDVNGRNALFHAVMAHNVALTSLLLSDVNVDLNARDSDGKRK